MAPSMMATQYYGMPGATPPSWGAVYPAATAQNAAMMSAGQQTPGGTPGTPQSAVMRQSARSTTPLQQQETLTAAALHTPGLLVHWSFYQSVFFSVLSHQSEQLL